MVQRPTEEDDEAGHESPVVIGATCPHTVYAPVNPRGTGAGAGHAPPALVDPQGMATSRHHPTGAPPGIGSVPFEALEREVPEGTLSTLHTDGLFATRDRDVPQGPAVATTSRGVAVLRLTPWGLAA
ncbi:SpoIIE family protein phosphatase [Streptomyces collinus]|uniref:SpoIIE family protein phosphatase n=1 Tax=Streptomyces collinus TaxID=42684 RepID=UPI003674CAA0